MLILFLFPLDGAQYLEGLFDFAEKYMETTRAPYVLIMCHVYCYPISFLDSNMFSFFKSKR